MCSHRTRVGPVGRQSSPGKWCKSSALFSTVRALAAHAGWSSATGPSCAPRLGRRRTRGCRPRRVRAARRPSACARRGARWLLKAGRGACSRSSALKIGRINAASDPCWFLRACPRQSRRKCTVQRCQAQPRTFAIAFKPACASEIASWTPTRRLTRPLRKSVQNASVSASPTSIERISRRPVAVAMRRAVLGPALTALRADQRGDLRAPSSPPRRPWPPRGSRPVLIEQHLLDDLLDRHPVGIHRRMSRTPQVSAWLARAEVPLTASSTLPTRLTQDRTGRYTRRRGAAGAARTSITSQPGAPESGWDQLGVGAWQGAG